jgi:sulfatase modifying factor 1
VEKQFGSPWVVVAVAFVACVVGRAPPRRTTALRFDVGARDAARDAGEPAAEPAETAPACPAEMVLVDAQACPDVEETCRRWADPTSRRYAHLRCAEYAPPKCGGRRQHRRYCIDRDEYVRPPETLPLVHVSFGEAEAICEQRGAQLCTEPEWELACEGEAMLPYPYGLVRDSTACNFDRTDLGRPNEGLIDHRVPPGAFPRCESPFGVHDMVGNVDEWTRREHERAPHRGALHGGWWLPARNNCFAATLGHEEAYEGPQVGFRCCRAASPPNPAPR